VAKKKIKRVAGDIVRVDLGDGVHSYARVMEKGIFAFYDVRTDKELKPEDILFRNVLFKIGVMDFAVTSGHWPVVGHVPLEPALKQQPTFFMQDPINKSLSIYQGGEMRPATRAECEGLERAAGWDPEHVEDRLRDHFAGQPNKWVESLKIK
jgi:hypothetical protein